MSWALPHWVLLQSSPSNEKNVIFANRWRWLRKNCESLKYVMVSEKGTFTYLIHQGTKLTKLMKWEADKIVWYNHKIYCMHKIRGRILTMILTCTTFWAIEWAYDKRIVQTHMHIKITKHQLYKSQAQENPKKQWS